MLRLFLFSLLAVPFQRFKITPSDYDFNNELNNVVVSISALGYLLPKFLKVSKPCKKDEDCPLVMRCCEVGPNNYCCSPNNYIVMHLGIMKLIIK